MKILYIITLMMVLSCGNRKAALEKKSVESDTSLVTTLQQKTIATANAESYVNLQKFLDQYDVSVTNAKSNYQLGFSGLTFSGNADLEIKKKSNGTILTTYSKTVTTYKSVTDYKSVTNYKTVTTYKSKESGSKRPMWWLYVLIFCGGFFIKPILKLITKK